MRRRPEIHHDTAQGSFLLNPLRKSRELADLIGMESIDDPKRAIGAIWALYDEQSQALDAPPELAHVARTMDFPLITVLARMEYAGIKLDSSKLAVMDAKLTTDIAEIQRQMYDMVGYEFNIASPAQLAEVLFTNCSCRPLGSKKARLAIALVKKSSINSAGSTRDHRTNRAVPRADKTPKYVCADVASTS